ncbi:unnamed protein product [Somion occarium]|uniref:Ribosome maturation protein SDO1/SBDS N-terminal domain-containing protein n=1 Tax=Somion occarium TaxID=3059160 RepID=A0ABP1D0D9_9APHY
MPATRNTGAQIGKVVYKPEPKSTDEFVVIVHPSEYKKWKEGDRYHSQRFSTVCLCAYNTLIFIAVLLTRPPIAAFEIFHSTQGAQGILGRPSHQQLENEFGTHKDLDVALQILEKGKLEASSGIDTSTIGTNLSKGSFSLDTRGARNMTGTSS